MSLRWFWRWCPCVKCHTRRHPPQRRHVLNMPKLLALILDEGFDIRDANEFLRRDISETLGIVNNRRFQIPLSGLTPPPDDFAERKSYSYGVFAPTGGVGTGTREDLLD